MKKWICFALSVLLIFSFTACATEQAKTETTSDTGSKTELTVFAAASLTEALSEIAESYKSVDPNVSIVFNFDSSGTLQKQIENGADADLFISAAEKQMDALEDGQYIAGGTRKNLLQNKLVLIVPEDSDKNIQSFSDLTDDSITTIALGNADVPVGQYSEEIFKSLNIWDALQSKISFGSNVKEVLSQVENGSVDCGVVYATDAATADNIKVVCEAPADTHQPVVYPAAVLKNSLHADAASAFLDYLSSDAAITAFSAVGFEIIQ